MSLIKALQIRLSSERVYGLDILRATAIFFVVLEHGGAYLEGKLQYYYYLTFVHDGVSMFFVLSGFLIGTILIKTLEKEKATISTLGNFWIRRWVRTIPPYFLILTILIIIDKPFDPGYNRSLTKHYYIFNQNFSTPQPNFFPESWSISVEEWFYLLVPSLIFIAVGLFRINHKIVIPVIAFCVIVAITFVRVYRVEHMDFHGDYKWDFYLRKQVITRLDTPMFGIIGAYMAQYLKKAWLKFRYPLLIAGIVLLLLHRYSFLWLRGTPFFYMYECIFSFSLAALATLFLLPYLSEIKQGKGFLYKVITYTSIISYSIYMLNLSVVQHLILPEIISTPSWTGYILFWILTYILSLIMYKYFEKPVMELRQKIKIKKNQSQIVVK
jgi:peptidoglycan/LPS O-acetylase OafA/YrhL